MKAYEVARTRLRRDTSATDKNVKHPRSEVSPCRIVSLLKIQGLTVDGGQGDRGGEGSDVWRVQITRGGRRVMRTDVKGRSGPWQDVETSELCCLTLRDRN